jgi:hypothetical protein
MMFHPIGIGSMFESYSATVVQRGKTAAGPSLVRFFLERSNPFPEVRTTPRLIEERILLPCGGVF